MYIGTYIFPSNEFTFLLGMIRKVLVNLHLQKHFKLNRLLLLNRRMT